METGDGISRGLDQPIDRRSFCAVFLLHEYLCRAVESFGAHEAAPRAHKAAPY